MTPEQEKQARIARQMFQNMLDELDLPGYVEAARYRAQRMPWSPKVQPAPPRETPQETEALMRVLADARKAREK